MANKNKGKVLSSTKKKVQNAKLRAEIDTAECAAEVEFYVCEICSRKFWNKSKLDRHEEYHLDADDKPFACAVCHCKFAYKANLTAHSRSHIDEKPFKAEYARSHRSRCQGCKAPIKEGNLRIAVMERSQVFDGRMTRWHHPDCFFDEQIPITETANWVFYDGLVEHFEFLLEEDQEWIRSKFEFKASDGGSQKNVDEQDENNEEVSRNFLVEYAKFKYGCKACEKKIMKDEIRILVKVYPKKMINTGKKGKNIGQDDASKDLAGKWHHLTCFANLRSKLDYFESGEKLHGFKTLNREDQEEVLKELPAIQRGNPAKKRKF